MVGDGLSARSQVGIGTLAVFIAMVLVALIAGGVLIETTGLLKGKSAATGQQSSSQVTDRVRVESATASYSSGKMQRIDVVLSKAPGSGDIDLSEMVVHWLGPNGSTELTASTFSISPIRGSGTVLRDRADRMNLSKFGKTIPDGTPATVRFITPSGGTTTAILRTPNAPPSDGAVSLLWKSPSGNPASGSGTTTLTATATPTPTPTSTPSSPQSSVEWTYSGSDVQRVAADAGTSLYVTALCCGYSDFDYWIEEIDPSTGSKLTQSAKSGVYPAEFKIDDNDRPLYKGGSFYDVYRWDPVANSTNTIYTNDDKSNGDAFVLSGYGLENGDIYFQAVYASSTQRRDLDGTLQWNKSTDRGHDLVVTGSGVYVAAGTKIIRYDHSGTVQWTTDIGEAPEEIEVGDGNYLYVSSTNKVRKLRKSDGTEASPSYSSGGFYRFDIGPEGYIYLPDDDQLTVLDPADLSVVLTHDFGNTVRDVESRSDGTYVIVDDGTGALQKLNVEGLP